MKKQIRHLSLVLKQNVLSGWAILALLAAACGNDNVAASKAATTGGTTVGGPEEIFSMVWTEVYADAADSTTHFARLFSHTSVVFNDGTGDALWVIGGYAGWRTNEVWRSTDGQTWNQVPKADNASEFPERNSHTTLVFKDAAGEAMWIIGGINSTEMLNDVWRSTDGKTWTEATTAATSANRFTARSIHASVVFNDGSGDAMWVIGGYNDTNKNYYNDVWRSTNGREWSVQTSAAGFSKRSGHQALTFNGALWVIGGAETASSIKYNDVWRTP